jgi:hypothetical protein
VNQKVTVSGISVNLSPDAFHRGARHFYKCRHDFKSPDGFSPLPYFLLCRAIELQLKSLHLQSMKQSQVKKQFGHDLVAAYEDLQPSDKILDHDEYSTLQSANAIYMDKGFEYFVPVDALTAYKRYPDLESLDAVARKCSVSIEVAQTGVSGK